MSGMDKYDVIGIARDEIKGFMLYRYCPKCDDTLPMIKFVVRVGKEIKSVFGMRQERSTRYRCMGCLTLWDEYTGEVK